MNGSVIRVRDLTKTYGRQTALDGVSFEVPAGVVFALLGENGAGKSTTIQCLLGLAEAERGTAEVLGLHSAVSGLEIRRRVGYVAERPALYEWMTVDELGWFAAGFYPGNTQGKYRELAAQFQLDLRKKIRQLSKGMRAKVALSLAMMHDPELLVLDEPTSGLDPLVRREFLESMVDVAASGKTVFLSSHQIHEVERVADIVAILHQGKLVALEPLEDLKREIREVTCHVEEGRPLPDLISGELLASRQRGRHCQWLVRGLPDEALQHLRQFPGVSNVEVRTPSLEEIFVAYLRRDARGTVSTAAERSWTS